MEKSKKEINDEILGIYTSFDHEKPEIAWSETMKALGGLADLSKLTEKQVRGKLIYLGCYRKIEGKAPAKKKVSEVPTKKEIAKKIYDCLESDMPGTFLNQSKADICKVGLDFSDIDVDLYTDLEKWIVKLESKD